MSFDAQLRQWSVKVESRTVGLLYAMGDLVQTSIVDGSPTTGAPGQPVDTGALKGSWIIQRMPSEVIVRTNVSYAPVIEHNLRSAYDPKGIKPERRNPDGSFRRSIKSVVGGHHSVKLTVAAADRLQAEALRELGD